MLRLVGSIAAVICALALAGCATTMSVSSHIQRGLDAASYRTYDWGPADALPTGDPRLDKNPFFQDQIQGAGQTYRWAPAGELSTGDPRLNNNPFFHEQVQTDIESHLATRGFEKITSDAPDLLLHYHASVTQQVDVNGVDRQYGYCNAGDCRPYVYESGTLLIDFVDARTEQACLARMGRSHRGPRD